MMSKRQIYIKDIVLTGLLAAVLSAGKQALAVIPNVEVVTLFIMLFAVCFKPQVCFGATIIFVVIEALIWGFSMWVISYIIHWNALSLLTYTFAQVLKIKNRFIYFGIAVIMTIAFGVLTSLLDAIVATEKSGHNFGVLFSAIYVRGVYFYLAQVIGNALINLLLFVPLRDLLLKLNARYYGTQSLVR